MMKKMWILGVIFVYLFGLVQAIGVAPANKDLVVAPGTSENIEYRIYNTESKEFSVSISVEGELSEHVEVEPEVLDFSRNDAVKRFTLKIDIPDSDQLPSSLRINILDNTENPEPSMKLSANLDLSIATGNVISDPQENTLQETDENQEDKADDKELKTATLGKKRPNLLLLGSLILIAVVVVNILWFTLVKGRGGPSIDPRDVASEMKLSEEYAELVDEGWEEQQSEKDKNNILEENSSDKASEDKQYRKLQEPEENRVPKDVQSATQATLSDKNARENPEKEHYTYDQDDLKNASKLQEDFDKEQVETQKDKAVTDSEKQHQEKHKESLKTAITSIQEKISPENEKDVFQPLRLEGNREIDSVPGLLDWLRSVDDETYSAHVHNEKDDFSSWVYHILRNRELGMKLYQTRSRNDAIRIIEEHIKYDKDNDKQHADQLKKEMDSIGKDF